MNVLIIGSGGREHAVAWKLVQSPHVTQIIAAPGNAGIAELGRCVETDLSPQHLLELAKRERIDLTFVGPEAPLVDGVVDAFEAAGLRIFGPNQKAARLEGSKSYSKDFMVRYNIPTATHESFSDSILALEYLENVTLPIVIKDANLAAGKGVTIAQTLEEARRAVENILGAPGGGEIVIEDFLMGQEVSLLLFTDGTTVKPLLLAQDYKQAFDDDEGPMTGGMGTVAPAPLLNEAQMEEVMTLRLSRRRYRACATKGSSTRACCLSG